MIKEPSVTVFDLVICLSDAVDLVSPYLVNHHKQTAYIAYALCKELGYDVTKQNDLLYAGALHDIGAISLSEHIETLKFEAENTIEHCVLGSRLLKLFEPLSHLSDIVRFHHTYWKDRKELESQNVSIPNESYILHLADRVAVLVKKNENILKQSHSIIETISEQSGEMFKPEIVEAFKKLSIKEHFWFDIISPTTYRTLRKKLRNKSIHLDLTQLNNLAMLFSKIIDFRSSFTATHSTGVAASAKVLAHFMGFSERECTMMKIAGYFHDLGKLAVPKEILEKPDKLTHDEFSIIRGHTYYTYHILDTLDDFDTINTWGAFHHERLNGNGYPFHHDAKVLSVGSRIMCVADVFTAITEDRPYREAMPQDKALNILEKMAGSGVLDSNIVSALKKNYDEVNKTRINAQENSSKIYDTIVNN